VGQASTLTEPGTAPWPGNGWAPRAARGTRSSTRRSRRQAAIGSVIVTLTPCPADGVQQTGRPNTVAGAVVAGTPPHHNHQIITESNGLETLRRWNIG